MSNKAKVIEEIETVFRLVTKAKHHERALLTVAINAGGTDIESKKARHAAITASINTITDLHLELCRRDVLTVDVLRACECGCEIQ